VSVKCLAEAIILQSIEDLWGKDLRSEGLTECTDMVKVNLYDQVKLINLINALISNIL